MKLAESIPLVGPIVQGLTGLATNITNRNIARESNAFMREMSNTAHQREVNDLIKAGLNPVLSATKGGYGASTPTAQMAKMENPLADITNSASQAMRLSSEIDKLRSDTDLSRSLSKKAEEEAETQATIRDTNTALQGVHVQSVVESKQKVRNMRVQAEKALVEIRSLNEKIKLTKSNIQKMKYENEKRKLMYPFYQYLNDEQTKAERRRTYDKHQREDKVRRELQGWDDIYKKLREEMKKTY